MEVIIAPKARSDIANILVWTQENFGPRTMKRYYYKAIIPVPGIFKKGLFVELELANTDPDYPEVRMVNAHEQQ